MRRHGKLKSHGESHPFSIIGTTAFEADSVVLYEDVPADSEAMMTSAEEFS